MKSITKAVEVLHRGRWLLLVLMIVANSALRGEHGVDALAVVATAIAFAGFWIPGLVGLVRDQSPRAGVMAPEPNDRSG